MKNNKCRICHRVMANNDKYIKIKEKILYDLEDGEDYWWSFQKAIICWDCIKKVREMVKSS